ncbi:MAG: site-specific DNA-methyltransferase [Selenomonadaceae bacterium]|nr:site-specific DNA-methyltransferase [Selenomonadaceae bacterium]
MKKFKLYSLFGEQEEKVFEPITTNIIEFDGNFSLEQSVNNIIHGDCLQVMRTMPNQCVDIVITSPPYNLLNSTGNGLSKNTKVGKWKNAAIKNGYVDYEDNMPYDEYVEWQRECVSEMCRIIKDDGAIFYNNKNRVQAGLLQDRGEILAGFPLRQIITWKRSGAINFNPGYFLPTTEQIYLLCGKNFKLAKGANKNTDVWQVKQEMKNPHPAPFPEELTDIIVSSTTGKIILDPFAGSGTTAISSRRYGRNFILIEKSRKYCEIAKARIDGREDWRDV